MGVGEQEACSVRSVYPESTVRGCERSQGTDVEQSVGLVEVTVSSLLGPANERITIVEWLVPAGRDVAAGTVLCVVETQKAVADIPSPVAGRVVKQIGMAGTHVSVGDVLCVLEVEGETSYRSDARARTARKAGKGR